jgi:hypothetical protein
MSSEVTRFELVVGVRRAVCTRPGHGGPRRGLIEYPTGSGSNVTLDVVAADFWEQLVSLFLVDQDGRRPCFGGVQRMQTDPRWRDNLLFHEYFHGDTGAGLGASHQTGWTGLVADVIRRRHRTHPKASEVIQRLVRGEETA